MNHQTQPPTPGLLADALWDPLPIPVFGSALYEWLHAIQGTFPLWCFEPYAYYNLQDTQLATTFPLQVIIDSIVEDDGLPTDPLAPFDPPLATVDRRRGWLAGTATVTPALSERAEWVYEEDEAVQLTAVPQPQLVAAPELFDPGFESEHYFDPPHYEATKIGRELAQRYEEREAARAADETLLRDAAKSKLRRFLKKIGISWGRGQPRKGPPDALLEALVREGRALFELCDEVCPFEQSERCIRILRDHDVEPDETWAWAVNLALPILSGHEVRVLGQQLLAARDWTRDSGRPTPRRLAVYCVAHRLGMNAGSIGEKALGSGDEFRGRSNPFEGPTP